MDGIQQASIKKSSAQSKNIAFKANNSSHVTSKNSSPAGGFVRGLSHKSIYSISFTSLYSDKSGMKLHNPLTFKANFPDCPIKDFLKSSRPKDVTLAKALDDHYSNNMFNALYPHPSVVGNGKRWLVEHPSKTLSRDAFDSLMFAKVVANKDFSDGFKSPDFGNNWAHTANYIEINPRVIGRVKGGKVNEGIQSATRMLLTMPHFQDGVASCIVLPGLFPATRHDGEIYESDNSSIYTANLKTDDTIGEVDSSKIETDKSGRIKDYKKFKEIIENKRKRDFSSSIVSKKLIDKGMSSEKQIKAFNDLAHFLGHKTCARIPINTDQLRIKGKMLSWKNNTNELWDNLVRASSFAIHLGFDSIYFDYGPYAKDNDFDKLSGEGKIPDTKMLENLVSSLKWEFDKKELAFITNYAGFSQRDLIKFGFSACDSQYEVRASSYDHFKQFSVGQYVNCPRVGVHVPNNLSTEEKIKAYEWALKGFGVDRKLPVFMKMSDLFPLNKYVDYDTLAQTSKSFVPSGANDELQHCINHWDALFDQSREAEDYRKKLNDLILKL